MTLTLRYTIERTAAVLNEIARLRQDEFPYRHSLQALRLIEERFAETLALLESFDDRSDPDVVTRRCSLALRDICEYLPLLGFIRRSTNVRNAFEVYGPLLRLARQLLGENTKLVLSSEWDYSPLAYAEIPCLPNFVLIGFPAPESTNPLLLPLAGHELGHCVWRVGRFVSEFRARLLRHVIGEAKSRWTEYNTHHPGLTQDELETGLLGRQSLALAVDSATRQTEETFCDFIGVRVFGTSFLSAFAYLLSPSWSPSRAWDYPSPRRRAQNLAKAATKYGAPLDPSYSSLFDELPNPRTLSPAQLFEISLADHALDSVVDDLLSAADEIVSERIPHLLEQDARTGAILERFRLTVPADRSGGLRSILNSAWQANNTDAFWPKSAGVTKPTITLREIVLKSIEILEIEHLTQTHVGQDAKP